MARSFVKGTLQMTSIDENKKKENVSLGHVESSPKSCVKICRLSYSLFAFSEVDKEGACVSLPGIV